MAGGAECDEGEREEAEVSFPLGGLPGLGAPECDSAKLAPANQTAKSTSRVRTLHRGGWGWRDQRLFRVQGNPCTRRGTWSRHLRGRRSGRGQDGQARRWAR